MKCVSKFRWAKKNPVNTEETCTKQHKMNIIKVINRPEKRRERNACAIVTASGRLIMKVVYVV